MHFSRRSLFLINGIIIFLSFSVSGCFLFRKAKSNLPFETIQLPAGAFMMGDFIAEQDPDATPLHRVVMPPFELSKYEITYAQYDTFAVANNLPLPEDDGHGRGTRAVANISWEDAQAYCTHYGFRLPSEAEWEYAARDAGQKTLFPGTHDKDKADDYIRHTDNSILHSFPGGTKAPNKLGFYDMGGNVYEWIGDYYEKYPGPGEKPVYKDLTISSMRIIRGGSFKASVRQAITFSRSGTLGDIPSNAVGFRCARVTL